MSSPHFQIQMIKVPVSDIEASSKFYSETLGFELQFAAEEFGWAQLSAGEVSLALYKPGMGGGNGHISGSVDFHLMLANPSFEELANRLLEAGHLAEDMIHTGNDGSSFVDVLDPDGNIVKIMMC